jgi:hypothetical protein
VNFSVGSRVWVQAVFKDAGGQYVDPSNPTVDILMPNGTVYISGGVPKRMILGAFNFAFDLPFDSTLGDWTARWLATIEGQAAASNETFTVVPLGQGASGHYGVNESLTVTQMLLAREGAEVVLMRPPASVSDGEGGTVAPTGPSVPLAAQTMLVSGVTRDSSYAVAEQGERLVNRFVVIGLPDLDIKQGDELAWLGETIKIDMVYEDRRWQTKAEGERVTNADG